MKIAAVKYLNTLPMLNGLSEAGLDDEVQVIQEDPATCARLLADGEVDAALCPIGAIAGLDHFDIVSNYGIGCDGPVRTVAVYSDQPISELSAIRLYPESRSSNLLVQVIERNFWNYGIEFLAPGTADDRPTGQLVIGDKCFEYESRYPWITDLGEVWKQCTGMPFLFAAWISLKPADKQLWREIDAAFGIGIENLDTLALPVDQEHIDLRAYLRENIHYAITPEIREGMTKFIQLARQLHKPRIYASGTSSRQSI